MNFKKLFSHFWAIRVKNIPSQISGNLEVNLVYGKKYLDTQTTNYSYGPLQRILKKGLSAMNLTDNAIKKGLLLGMGAGSVLETLRKDFHIKAPIDCVEIDPAVIDIAIKEFDVYQYQPITIYQQDAFDFIQQCKSCYDLIIIDVFVIDVIPEPLTQKEYIDRICQCLAKQGKILFNLMLSTIKTEQIKVIQHYFELNGLSVQIIQEVENTNCLIIVFKD